MTKKVAHERDRIAELDEATRRAEAYVPSYEASILARIYDGEARTPWQAVPDDAPENDPRERVTDYDLRRGAGLLAVILETFRTGDREALDRLEAAAAALRGAPDDKAAQLASYVRSIESYAQRLRRDRWLLDNPGVIVEALGRDAHPNFLSLDPWELRDALMSDESALMTATRLAIDVEAFDTEQDPEPGSAAQLDRVKDRLKKAVKRVK